MLFQKPLRALMENQLCADVLPADALLGGARMEGGVLRVGENTYASLVIPACEHLPAGLAGFLMQAAKDGLQVVFVDRRPARDTLEQPLPAGFSACGDVAGLDGLAALVQAHGKPVAEFAERSKDLRLYATRQGEDTVLMFFNEAVDTPVDTTVRRPGGCAALEWYDAAANRGAARLVRDSQFALRLAPGESAVAVVYKEAPMGTRPAPVVAETAVLDNGWEISASAIEDYPAFRPRQSLAPGEPLPNMNTTGENQSFVGVFRYQTTFAARAGAFVRLHLPKVSDGAAVTVNGKDAGTMLGNSGRLDIGDLLADGENTLTVEVPNTLVWRMKDPVSAFVQVPPTGLLQPPVLEYL
jgi:hypothetical protein